MKIFVYGTLKRDHGNYHLLRHEKFMTECMTVANGKLYDAGFPVLELPVKDGLAVCGELFDLDDPQTLPRLDRLECEGRMYHRRKIMVECISGIRHSAYAYIGDPDFIRGLKPLRTNGLWYEWPEKRK